MNKKKIFISIISIALVITSVVSYADQEVIRFASAVYPPFTIVKNGQISHGFDIDIARALCNKMNVHCVFSQEPFAKMSSTLNAGKYDAWINAVSICHQHQKDIALTRPYFSSEAELIALKNTVFNASPDEIKGRTIGVAENTCYIQYLNSTYGDTVNIKTFPTERESFIALKNGVVDAVIDDAVVLKQWRSEQNDKKKYRLIGLPAKYSDLVWHKYGIAVAKCNTALINKLNNAIEHIKAEGTYDKLVEKYFSN